MDLAIATIAFNPQNFCCASWCNQMQLPAVGFKRLQTGWRSRKPEKFPEVAFLQVADTQEVVVLTALQFRKIPVLQPRMGRKELNVKEQPLETAWMTQVIGENYTVHADGASRR